MNFATNKCNKNIGAKTVDFIKHKRFKFGTIFEPVFFLTKCKVLGCNTMFLNLCATSDF